MTKILIVEDNKIPAITLKRMLQMYLDSEVIIAYNSEEAFSLATENHFDLILMDIGLGEGPDGIETTIMIRHFEVKNDREPSYICALTAHVDAETPEKHKTAGMNHTFQKPLDFKKIEFLVENVPTLNLIKSS